MTDPELLQSLSRRGVIGGAMKAAAGALVFGVSARALGLSPASAKVPDKIVIGRLPFNTEVTLYTDGLDAFKDEGLTIDYIQGAGGPAVVQALAAGSIPVGDIGVAPALIAAARKLPLVSPALGAIATPSHPSDRIMVLAGSPIRTVQDLKGKKLALHQRGTIEEFELVSMKRTYGVGLEDLDIAIVPIPNQPQVLAAKQVDAIFPVPPFDLIAERKFNARTLVNGSDINPYTGYGTLTFRTDFIEAYPEAAQKLMKAWIRICRWIDDNPGKANAAAGNLIGVEPDLQKDVRLCWFARNGLPVLPNVWQFYYMLLGAKLIEPSVDPKSLIDQSVVEPTKRVSLPALEAIGAQRDEEVAKMLKASYPQLPEPAEKYYAEWEPQMLRL
jgi:ABC-type nitrate/sulfonate/bicarbonate transport system substrate-binding protein